jgi:RNA polymerase sigma factor (sigma-70 family)
MWKALLLFSGDPDIASDAVAEAFAQVIHRGEGVRAIDRWTWRAAFLIAGRLLKDRARLTDASVDMPYTMPETTVDLVRALRSLPFMQRAAVVLRYYGDYDVATIARTLGTSKAAVSVHLHRARRRLHRLLEDGDA